MKGFSNSLMVGGGFVAAPFLVTLTSKFITDAYPWVPFLIVLLFAGVLTVGLLKGAGLGLLVGILLFGAFLVWYPRGVSFLPPDVRSIHPPF